MKRKVLLIRSRMVPPDPPVEKAARFLVKKGYKVKIISWDRDADYKIKTGFMPTGEGQIEIVTFGIKGTFSGGLKKNLLPMLKFLVRLAKYLKENKDSFDIIHAFDLDVGIVAKRYAKKYNKKFVYHILDFYAACRLEKGTFFYNLIKNVEFGVIKSADATIICSEKRKEQIEGSCPKKLYVIHNTPEAVVFEPQNIENEKMKVVYAGVFLYGRLLDELLEVVDSDERMELHIAGFGEMEEKIQALSQKNERIHYYGKLPYSEVLKLESQCDVMTVLYDPKIPNHSYAAPNKLYEALMLGKPFVMCKNTGWDEVVEKERVGVLIECSKSGLEEGLNALYNNKNSWKAMEERGRSLYEHEYSWSVMEKRLSDLYDEISR